MCAADWSRAACRVLSILLDLIAISHSHRVTPFLDLGRKILRIRERERLISRCHERETTISPDSSSNSYVMDTPIHQMEFLLVPPNPNDWSNKRHLPKLIAAKITTPRIILAVPNALAAGVHRPTLPTNRTHPDSHSSGPHALIP